MKVFVFLVLLALATATPIPYTLCGTSPFVTLKTLESNVWPLKKNVPITFQGTGEAFTDIPGGSAQFDVYYWGVKVVSQTEDICHFLTCPIQKGPISIKQEVTIPTSAPGGTYKVEVHLTDTDGHGLLCVDVEAAISQTLDLKAPAIDDDLIREINGRNGNTWVAGRNAHFEGKTKEFVKGLLGALEGGPKLPLQEPLKAVNLPENFDPREQWGTMCNSLYEVRDQGACGSCWAFGAAAAMTDRLCIASKGAVNFELAAADLVACCGFFTCGMGCNGGYPSGAWSYWKSTGIVTGGPFNTTGTCWPYPIAACDHHTTGHLDPCGDTQPTPSCAKKCLNGADWNKDKHYGASSYSVASNEAAIMNELYTNGPAEAAFTVYDDFVNYKSGVYQYVSGSQLGGHAVKIMGWGVEKGVPYWLIANSWNEDWGDKGLFKILRGKNECGIEAGIVAGLPKI